MSRLKCLTCLPIELNPIVKTQLDSIVDYIIYIENQYKESNSILSPLQIYLLVTKIHDMVLLKSHKHGFEIKSMDNLMTHLDTLVYLLSVKNQVNPLFQEMEKIGLTLEKIDPSEIKKLDLSDEEIGLYLQRWTCIYLLLKRYYTE